MSNNEVLQRRRQSAVPRGVGNTHAIFADRAENARLWDVEGREYIDFAAGIAVLNTGHRHPKIMDAMADQARRFTHTCFHVSPYEPYIELAERLNALVPGVQPRKTMLVTTGAEAVENAVKIARAHTGRSAVIAFDGAFHGRTLLAVGLTAKVNPYKKGFGPFPADIFHARYPDGFSGISVDEAIASVEQLLQYEVDAERVAAIIVEPVQGEGGFRIAPPEFLQRLRALTKKHGILLIVDEIQTGFGRTGRMFACEHAGIRPDLMTMAKSLAGGFPLAAITGTADVMDAPAPGGLGGTYAGNPLACAAALAVLDVIESENLLARSATIGQRMSNALESLGGRFAAMRGIRNLGAMVAFELFTSDGEPDAGATARLLAAGEDTGVILISCGVNANVVRLLPPLTATDEDIEQGLERLTTALERVYEQAEIAATAG